MGFESQCGRSRSRQGGQEGRIQLPVEAKTVPEKGTRWAVVWDGDAGRHTRGEGAYAGAGLELRKIGSCVLGCSNGRRAEPHLNRGEAFDEHHRATTFRASPQGSRRRKFFLGIGFGPGGAACREELKAEWQQRAASPVGHKTEVPNADESPR